MFSAGSWSQNIVWLLDSSTALRTRYQRDQTVRELKTGFKVLKYDLSKQVFLSFQNRGHFLGAQNQLHSGEKARHLAYLRLSFLLKEQN